MIQCCTMSGRTWHGHGMGQLSHHDDPMWLVWPKPWRPVLLRSLGRCFLRCWDSTHEIPWNSWKQLETAAHIIWSWPRFSGQGTNCQGAVCTLCTLSTPLHPLRSWLMSPKLRRSFHLVRNCSVSSGVKFLRPHRNTSSDVSNGTS